MHTPIAKLMGVTISEIKRDVNQITLYDQNANPIMIIVEMSGGINRDTVYDGHGNFFDMDDVE